MRACLSSSNGLPGRLYTRGSESSGNPVKIKLGARAESSKPRKPRTTPQNPEKISIIQELAEFLTEKGYKNVEITNESKLIEFNFGKNCYKLDLICKRQPKN